MPVLLADRANRSPGKYTSPVGITGDELAALDAGDLSRFWELRAGRDPVARMGLSIWGSDDVLRRSIERHPRFWRSRPGPWGRLLLTIGGPGLPPKGTTDELMAYWRRIVEGPTTELRERLAAKGPGAPTFPEVSRALARAHVEALLRDERKGLGARGGLLSARQIADYHRDVFDAAGLPRSTFGGTPVPRVPGRLQALVMADTYAPDGDPCG